ncbi:hypothetical protein AcW1_004321 [Taiwanofungus camphoratus]|nr:hypothetical protein AcW1_004321 [Antrodia cinnamomea]
MSSSLSPPPRMPSPHLPPSPLSSPPLIPRRTSRNRLQLPPHPEEPPIPPRLVGSPLLEKFTSNSPHEPHLLSQKAQSELWIDGDEFGTRNRELSGQNPIPSSSASPGSGSSPRRSHRRSASLVPHRARSPPPAPLSTSPPPPVPPIPSFALATPGTKRSVVYSQPASHTQVKGPNLGMSSPLNHPSPPKRNRWARGEAWIATCIERLALHSSSRSVQS